LIVDLSKGGPGGRQAVWGGQSRRGGRVRPGKSPVRDALEKAGLVPPEEPPPPDDLDQPGRAPRGDLIPGGLESTLEPGISMEQRRKLREQIRREAAKALSLQKMRKEMDRQADGDDTAQEPQRGEDIIKALRGAYAPPWQLALQRWLDAVAPAGRSFARA